MSTEQTEQEEPDYMNNGMVKLEIVVGDPVTDLGIRTDHVSVESEKSFVTKQLAEHLWDEYFIDVEEHDIEVVE